MDHLAGMSFEQVNQVFGGALCPPASSHEIALGAHCNGINFSNIAWTRRHADCSQQLAISERPHANGLVIRTGHCDAPGSVHSNGSDHCSVHAGIDHQHRLLVKRGCYPGGAGHVQLTMLKRASPRQRIAAGVIPERQSLIRDRNRLKRWVFTIPARASLGRDDNPLAKVAAFA